MSFTKTDISPGDVVQLSSGLQVGSQISVTGRVTDCTSTPRFAINIQKSACAGSDIGCHFNPRNDMGYVVRNSFENGCWRTEETDTPSFPFTHGARFHVCFEVTQCDYVVMVNGVFFVRFAHRLAYGDMHYVRFTEGAEYHQLSVKAICRAPYLGIIEGGLKPGMAVVVTGMVHDDATRFDVNFNCDENGNKIGFHFNPRQHANQVVMNSKLAGWGCEERPEGTFPFPRGEYFHLLFIVEDNEFRIYANHTYFTSYTFRCPVEEIRFLQIHGDLDIMEVKHVLQPVNDCFIKPITSMAEDDLVVVKGYFYAGGDRFAINLMQGTEENSDCCLHINPRRGQGVVVLNSMVNGCWQTEERHPLPDCFMDRNIFWVTVYNKNGKFHITMNGVKLATFDNRCCLSSVKAIGLKGDARFYLANIYRKVTNPHVSCMPKTMSPGSWVTVTGSPNGGGCSSYAINLQTGDNSVYHQCDIALHTNPRHSGEVVVRNSLENGAWRCEERDQPCFPFAHDQQFKVFILATSSGYKIFVNKKHFVDFAHRVCLDRVTHVFLTADADFMAPEFY